MLKIKIHPAGAPFIFLICTATLFLYGTSSVFASLGAIVSAWCIYFFRNPDRVTPMDPNLVISAADGIVSQIIMAPAPGELGLPDGDWLRISVFLNIFDVHVNRIPVSGTIVKRHYHPGKFFNASLDKASEHNERNSLVIQNDHQESIIVVQIAGLIARRIICDVGENDSVEVGARYGIIRFGSRTDVYLPKTFESCVLEGQRMIGGETVIAKRI